MEMKNFKQLQKDELKNIKGGDTALVDNGENVLIEFFLRLHPRFFKKEN